MALIDKDAAVVAVRDAFKPNTTRAIRAMHVIRELEEVEPLTDAEKIFFDAVMRSERMTCRDRDDSDGVNLCDEIIKKVRGALWT